MTMLYYTDPVAWQRLHIGPLSPHISTFAQHLAEQGYARQTARVKLNLVATFSQWLEHQQLGIEAVDEPRIRTFLEAPSHQCRCSHRGDFATLKALSKHLRAGGVIASPPPAIDTSALGQLEREYRRYLVQERGLTEATLANYVPLVRRFLIARFGHGPLRLDQLQLHDVTDYVLHQAVVFRSRHAKLVVTALRSFLRLLRQRGEIELDLAAAVPTVAHWRLSTLPKYLPPDQVEQVLQSCDQCTVLGQRDYTVLLLLARLGRRAGEIVHLCLEDLDWDAGLLKVRGKGGHAARLPLPQDVGAALAQYLRDGRPRCTTRRVFIRMKAPHSGFASSVAIDSLLRRALKRADLAPTFKGSHLLRHSLATHMLRNGASMAEIGQLLRHRQAQTTEIYAKVDSTALGALAQPWPEGAL